CRPPPRAPARFDNLLQMKRWVEANNTQGCPLPTQSRRPLRRSCYPLRLRILFRLHASRVAHSSSVTALCHGSRRHPFRKHDDIGGRCFEEEGVGGWEYDELRCPTSRVERKPRADGGICTHLP